MNVEFLFIADAVEAVNGKLYVMGGAWNETRSPAYPANVRIGIAVALSVPWNETNERHPIRVSLLDADGGAVIPEMGGEVEAGRPIGVTAGTDQRAVVAINGVFPIPRPGRYEVRVQSGSDTKSAYFEALLAGASSFNVQ